MTQRQAVDEAAGVGVEERGALPREVRQHHEPLGTRWQLCRLRRELFVRRTGQVPQPARDRARRRHARGQTVGPLERSRSAPQVRAGQGPLQGGDQEHRRSVHQHEIAGGCHADADGLRPGVDRAGDDRGAPRDAGAGLGLGGDGAHGVGRPDQFGPGEARRDLLAALADPGAGRQVVERCALARRVVVEDVPAGEAVHEVRTRHVPAVGGRVRRRLVAAEPGQLGPDGLAGQGCAAAADDVLGAVAFVLLGDLGDGARVDAVQDGRADRRAPVVGRQQTRADAADADRGERLPRGPPGQQLLRQRAEFAPPHPFRVVLEPVGEGRGRRVLAPRLGDERAVGADQNALGGGRADVDAEQQTATGGLGGGLGSGLGGGGHGTMEST